MRLPFSGRYEKLETMNRVLTDAARKRAERIEELERRVAQLEWELEERVAQLKRELETAREASETAREAMERTKLLEVVAAERAQLLNEKDKQLADVREAATKYCFRIQELERSLAEIGQK
jgi:methyl-accepting chemotaxis protein